jgi:5'(3')-deoxyribonucleotidase
MKIIELLENVEVKGEEEATLPPMPHLYLDMDGVQADFFTAWANIHNKARYKEIGDKEEREKSISDLTNRGPEFIYKFFAELPPLNGGMALVQWIKKNNIPFTILSAPLRGNYEASIEGKKDWLDKYNPGTSQSAIFTGMKEKYASKQQPNILVDDHKKYIERWEQAGGIGILHRDNNTNHTIEQLAKIYEPYKLNG